VGWFPVLRYLASLREKAGVKRVHPITKGKRVTFHPVTPIRAGSELGPMPLKGSRKGEDRP
jgi:hypothetical protein